VREGRFPLVVFSHGNGGSRHQNTFWCDCLASHGYVIVAPDHTGNARWTILDGKPIVAQSAERMNSARDRPLDVCFLLDQMIRWDQGADRRFAGRIDTAQAAVAGMSFGSFTAHWAADRDPRFRAVVAMSGAPPTHTNLTVPSLRMLGTEDRTLGVLGNTLIRANHVQHTGPAFLLELKNGGHYSFTDVFKINKNFGDGIGAGRRRDTNEPFEFTSMELTYRIVNSCSVAFLGYYLKGQDEYGTFLTGNHWPEIVNWEVKGLVRLPPQYPKLNPEPFGKGIFGHVRAGGKIRGSPQSLRALAENPYVAGTQLSYCWSELEPQEGQYRWDIIEDDMDVWAQNGKKCWLEVATAFRWDPSGRLGVPAWAYDKGVPRIQAAGSAPYPVYWHPLYLELWGKFVTALGRKFDGDPRLEWVAVGGHTTGTEPRLSSKENDLVMEQWVKAGFDGFTPEGVYLQRAILPIYRMFRIAFRRTPVSATFISVGEFSEVMNRFAAEQGFMLTSNGFGARAATRSARTTMRQRQETWGTKVAYAEFGPSGRDSRFLQEDFVKPPGVTVKEMRDAKYTARLMDIYRGAIGDDHDPSLEPHSRLSYVPLSERAPAVETEQEWNAALKWACEHLEK
jgi:dienelactone hydrolase